jgi:hypothetical protein
MDKNTDKFCVLRILTGVAAGAEVELRIGLKYLLGRSDEMDLIIDDPALEESHAQITVEGQSVRVTPVDDAAVQLHGERFEGGIVPLYVVLQLGETMVAFGDQRRNWNSVQIPEDALVAPLMRPADARPGADRDIDETGEDAVRQARPWLSRGQIGLLVATAALVVVALPTAVGGWRLFQMRQEAAQELANQENPIIALGKEIQHILAPVKKADRDPKWSPQWAALHLNRAGRTWALTGYLNTLPELQDLRGAIGERPILVRVLVRDVLERNLKQVVAAEKLNVGVEYIGDGRFAITGEPKDVQAWAADWSALVEQVNRDVPDIVDLIDRTSRSSRSEPTSQTPHSGTVAQRVQKQQIEPIVIPIKSVSVGRSGCLTLTNGERLFVGAQLPGGYRIDEIAVEQIVASRDGERVILKLNSGL